MGKFKLKNSLNILESLLLKYFITLINNELTNTFLRREFGKSVPQEKWLSTNVMTCLIKNHYLIESKV